MDAYTFYCRVIIGGESYNSTEFKRPCSYRPFIQNTATRPTHNIDYHCSGLLRLLTKTQRRCISERSSKNMPRRSVWGKIIVDPVSVPSWQNPRLMSPFHSFYESALLLPGWAGLWRLVTWGAQRCVQIQLESNNEVCILHPLPVFTQDDYLPAISIMTLPLPRC